MANRIRVEYVDEAVAAAEVAISPKASIAAERKFGKEMEAHQVEAGYYMAWFALGMPGGADGFDGWLDTVAGIEPVEHPPTAGSSSETSPL
jgi:hypothetical protein